MGDTIYISCRSKCIAKATVTKEFYQTTQIEDDRFCKPETGKKSGTKIFGIVNYILRKYTWANTKKNFAAIKTHFVIHQTHFGKIIK